MQHRAETHTSRCASGQKIKPPEAGYRRLGGGGKEKEKPSGGQKGKGCKRVHAQRALAQSIDRHAVRTHDITRNDFPVELAPQHPIFVYHFDPCNVCHRNVTTHPEGMFCCKCWEFSFFPPYVLIRNMQTFWAESNFFLPGARHKHYFTKSAFFCTCDTLAHRLWNR